MSAQPVRRCPAIAFVLHDAVACQDVLTACRAERPETILFTGEDRMFGPSLLCGADAAPVGIAAAVPGPTVEALAAWTERRYADFVRASAVVDALAAQAFRAPVDRYVQRMAWLVEWEGRPPGELCHDPIADPALLPEKAEFLTTVAVFCQSRPRRDTGRHRQSRDVAPGHLRAAAGRDRRIGDGRARPGPGACGRFVRGYREVAVTEDLAELAAACDVVMLLGPDWDERLGQVEELAALGVPGVLSPPRLWLR